MPIEHTELKAEELRTYLKVMGLAAVQNKHPSAGNSALVTEAYARYMDASEAYLECIYYCMEEHSCQ